MNYFWAVSGPKLFFVASLRQSKPIEFASLFSKLERKAGSPFGFAYVLASDLSQSNLVQVRQVPQQNPSSKHCHSTCCLLFQTANRVLLTFWPV